MSKYQELFDRYEQVSEKLHFLEGQNHDLTEAVEEMRKQRDLARRNEQKAIRRQLEMAEELRKLQESV